MTKYITKYQKKTQFIYLFHIQHKRNTVRIKVSQGVGVLWLNIKVPKSESEQDSQRFSDQHAVPGPPPPNRP